MPRTFAYVRVSTAGQTTENQINEIEAAGFKFKARRIAAETISGSRAIARSQGFMRLMDKLETGDILVVTKLDRLGRDAIDVSGTVAMLEKIGVRVHYLALGGVDLTSSTGKLTTGVLNSVAEFERDLLIERTEAGLNRAKSEDKVLDRPLSVNDKKCHQILIALAQGSSISSLARDHKISRQSIMRVKANRADLGQPTKSQTRCWDLSGVIPMIITDFAARCAFKKKCNRNGRVAEADFLIYANRIEEFDRKPIGGDQPK